MAIQKRAAQPLGSPTTRRPVNRMFRGGNPDFYSPQPVEKAKRKFTSGTTNRFYDRPLLAGAYDQEAFGRISNDNMMRMMQQSRQQFPSPQLPMSGAMSGWGQSHTPIMGEGHQPLFSEEQGQDLSFQATQQGGNPWFNPHQQSTRFAENFGAQSIRKRENLSPFGQ